MSSPVPRSLQDTQEQQWPALLALAPYVLLAIVVIAATTTRHARGHSLLINLALAALTAAWMLGMFTLHRAWRERALLMGVFLCGLIVIMVVLVVRDPLFAFFTPAGYLFAFRLLGWPWRLLGVAAVAAVAGIAQAYGIHRSTPVGLAIYVGIIAVNVVPMCLLAWAAEVNTSKTMEREQSLREVSEANCRLEAALAENAGLHEQLLTRAREAGVLDERRRMAREIHDTLAQGLVGIITQLQAAVDAVDDSAAWLRHVHAATCLARDSLSEARRSVEALRPEPLETARLSDALANVAAQWSALHGISAQVKTTGTACAMRPEAEFALLRTAQEALANVARHAQAGRVVVTLSYLQNEVALDVRDDGRGLEPAQPCDGAGRSPVTAPDGAPARREPVDCGGGFGLVAMRQRIEDLAGTLQVESEPGVGTTISACVPAVAAEVPA